MDDKKFSFVYLGFGLRQRAEKMMKINYSCVWHAFYIMSSLYFADSTLLFWNILLWFNKIIKLHEFSIINTSVNSMSLSTLTATIILLCSTRLYTDT